MHTVLNNLLENYAAAMNGLDAIVFTAGVGENDKVVRRLVCEKHVVFRS